MLVVKLREAMEAYRRRTGVRVTYTTLAERTGISESMIRKIGGIIGYHPTLEDIEKLCVVLGVTPGDLLEVIPEPPKLKASPKRKRKRKTATKKKK